MLSCSSHAQAILALKVAGEAHQGCREGLAERPFLVLQSYECLSPAACVGWLHNADDQPLGM